MGRRPLLIRRILKTRDRKRLERLADESGYETLSKMLYELYIVQQTPMKKIASDIFCIPFEHLRPLFDEFKIPVRPRGGANNVHVVMTQELYDEACRDGAGPVALRCGLDKLRLEQKLLEWQRSKKK